jgi:hypothetical protein
MRAFSIGHWLSLVLKVVEFTKIAEKPDNRRFVRHIKFARINPVAAGVASSSSWLWAYISR